MSLWLKSLGAEVVGFSKDVPTNPSLFQVADVERTLKHHFVGDIRNLGQLTESFQAADPEIVLHFAAQTIVSTGYQDPLETYSSNVMGTANVLEVVRNSGKSVSVLVVSTDKCYQNDGQHWGFRENDPLGEKDPYGSSKSAAELVVKSYRESFFSARKNRRAWRLSGICSRWKCYRRRRLDQRCARRRSREGSSR